MTTEQTSGDPALPAGLSPSVEPPSSVSPPDGASIPIADEPRTVTINFQTLELADGKRSVSVGHVDNDDSTWFRFVSDEGAVTKLRLSPEATRALFLLLLGDKRSDDFGGWWCDTTAQGIEARRAETPSAAPSSDESPVGDADAPVSNGTP